MGVSAAIGIATFISVSEGRKREKKVARANAEAQAVERAERATQATRARRQQVREARIRRAEVQNEAGVSGQTGSSAAIAAGDSLQNQLGTNLGTIGTSLATGEAKGIAQQNIFEADRKSDLEVLSGAALNFSGRVGG